ncbi:CD209 antigen-like protein 2 [Physella acuta]|uniref:CD209 antigen-like protein 2 n=1 Tax=Physella acuta TaxID=109671 RepID=UPI0027DCB976|nr:CD209 antigen-like protein 2 [Physella acuta]
MPTSVAISHMTTYVTTQLCNTASNFILQQNGSVSVCVRMSSAGVNYTDARDACQEFGGNLYTIKTQEKLNILKTIAGTFRFNFWVGLDDMETEGVFKWVDDGTTLTYNWTRTVFNVHQPSNGYPNGNEDCVEYNQLYKPLNDVNCIIILKYLCEKKVLIP